MKNQDDSKKHIDHESAISAYGGLFVATIGIEFGLLSLIFFGCVLLILGFGFQLAEMIIDYKIRRVEIQAIARQRRGGG